jgi:hypothetical protein
MVYAGTAVDNKLLGKRRIPAVIEVQHGAGIMRRMLLLSGGQNYYSYVAKQNALDGPC